MAGDLLHGDRTKGTDPYLVISEFREVSEPIVGKPCGYKWRIRLEGTRKFPNVESVTIICRLLPPDPAAYTINDWAPKAQSEPGASVQLTIAPAPSPVSIGINIPTVKRITEARQKGINEIRWTFFKVVLDELIATIEGAFSIIFDEPGEYSVDMSVKPRFFGNRFFISPLKKYAQDGPRCDEQVATLKAHKKP